jgi:pimeloyl-ACP methyl ester carboxylesterase
MDLQYSSTDTFSKTILRPRAVYAVDLRGRGNSDGERFYVEKFDDYVSDVRLPAERVTPALVQAATL